MCVRWCMCVYICMYMWQPKFKVGIFPNPFLHYHFFFYFECVYMLCLHACSRVNTCVPLCMNGCQGSTSGVGPHILQGLRLGLSLVVHCCEWQGSSLGSIQKFSCVYFSSHYMHVNIANVDITHSLRGLWRPATQASMLVHQGLCYPSHHLPSSNIDRIVIWTWSSWFWLDWLGFKFHISIISACQVLRFQVWTPLVFYLGAGDSNSDRHTFKKTPLQLS